VDRESLPAAKRALEEAGYRQGQHTDIEFKFGKPSSRIPTLSDDPYSRDTEPLIELHLAFWKGRAPLAEPQLLRQTVDHNWRGLRFPVLREDNAFVLQILHIFQHILECWVKLCWLIEIGHFLRARFYNAEFWNQLDAGMREIPCLAEYAAVVVGLSQKVFAAPVPLQATKWTFLLRPSARLWIENYGWMWAIQEHPYDGMSFLSPAKLAFFLHREFLSEPRVRRELWERLFPWKRPERIAIPADRAHASIVTANMQQLKFVTKRLIFHLGTNSRYLLEVPRWREVNRCGGSPPNRNH
jgi:Uncharacterised nucleotidyltransferase